MSAAPVCIAGASVLRDAGAEFEPASVLVADGRIVAVEGGDAAAALAARAAGTLDARGLVLLPGFVNAHHHAYANALRGTENSLPLELWALFTMAYGRALDAEALRLAILLGAAEMIRGGVTACIDHFPHVRHAEAAYAAHRESGMRVGFAPMMHDIHDHDFLRLDLPAGVRAGIEGAGFPPAERTEAMFRDLAARAGRDGGLVAILLGPNAPQRCSPALLDVWRRLRDGLGLGVHTHLLETRAQGRRSRELWAGGLVGEMARQGLLAPGLACAHGIWLEPDERDLLARHGVVVVHNPASNLMLGSGAMPLADYRARGVTLALGSDSANTGGRADLWELMRLATMLPRLAARDGAGWPDARVALGMATAGGAAALGLAGRLGAVRPGALADLQLVDPGGAAMAALEFTPAALVQHGGPDAVRAVMVGGAWVYRDGRILAFDEAAVLHAFARKAGAIRAAAADGVAAARAAVPLLARGLM